MVSYQVASRRSVLSHSAIGRKIGNARITIVLTLFGIVALSAAAQNPSSSPIAIKYAQQSVVALTRGISVADVTLDTTVAVGSAGESGTAMFQAKGTAESRLDLSAGNNSRSDVRNAQGGGAWRRGSSGSLRPYAGHNCYTDAAWFFPALSSLTKFHNPQFVFEYIGQETYQGVATQHIRVFRIASQDPSGSVPRLSTMDFFLDPSSFLPLVVKFNAHADHDINIDIPVEVRFSDYRTVSGVLVPFHFVKLMNGGVVLDATVNSAQVNSNVSDSAFSLQ